VREAIAKYPRKSYRKDSPEFQRIKSRAAQEKPMSAQQIAERQRQQSGQISNVSIRDVAPSGDFRSLDHSAFQIAYPSNWEVFGDQNSTVTIAPRAGVGQNAIAYGVIISGYKPQQPGESLEQATLELVNQLRQANPELRVSGSAQQANVSGARALAVNLTGPSPIENQGRPLAERDMLVTVQRPDGNLLFLIFIAPERDTQQLGPAYQRMLESLRLRG
jgi:hypothetical protein